MEQKSAAPGARIMGARAIKYASTSPCGWSVETCIVDGKAWDVASIGEGLGANLYCYEPRALTAPELLLVGLRDQAMNSVSG